MKRKSIIILGLILLVITSLSLTILAKEQVFDFRQTNWGMSMEQVKASEYNYPVFEDNTILNYYVAINEKDFICSYRFLNNKLYDIKCVFNEQYINKSLYIDHYEELKEIFIKKYGKPKFDEYRGKWGNDIYKNNKADLLKAISVGDEAYWTQWKTPITKIDLMLLGESNKINLILRYKSDNILKSEFLKIVKELNVPQKICTYMAKNFEYELHTACALVPYLLWERKKGDCDDFCTFGTYIANYHGYKTFQIFINFKAYTLGHVLAVYKQNGKYNYSSNWNYFPIRANNFEEIVDHYSSFDDEYEIKNYEVYDYEKNLIAEDE